MGIKRGINKSLRRFCINCLKRAYLSAHSMSRVIYDRIGNREICTFWNFHISVNWMWTTNVEIRKIQTNVTLPSNWCVCFEFPPLKLRRWKFKKAAKSKYIFLFCSLSYITLTITNSILKYQFQVSGLPLCDLLGGNHQDDILLYRAIR